MEKKKEFRQYLSTPASIIDGTSLSFHQSRMKGVLLLSFQDDAIQFYGVFSVSLDSREIKEGIKRCDL